MKKILIIIVSSLVFIVGISLYFYYSFGRPINRRIMAGTQTASLGDYLYHKYTDINDPLINEVKNEFNLFSDTDYKILEEHIINREEYERGGHELSKIPGKTLLDPWGNRFNVAVRYYENKQLEFLVWSKGPDGVNGTEDDFISANIENGVTKIKNHVQFFR